MHMATAAVRTAANIYTPYFFQQFSYGHSSVPKGKRYDYSQPAVQGVQYCNLLFAIEDSINKKYPGDYNKRKHLRLEGKTCSGGFLVVAWSTGSSPEYPWIKQLLMSWIDVIQRKPIWKTGGVALRTISVRMQSVHLQWPEELAVQ